jgi:predicted ester cyclase
MPAEENKALVRYYVEEVLNNGKLEALDDLLSSNYKRYLSPTVAPLTPEAQKKRLAGLRAAFPDIQLTIENLIAEGEQVAVHMTLHGTQQGAFQGLAPTGKQVTVSAIDVFSRYHESLRMELATPIHRKVKQPSRKYKNMTPATFVPHCDWCSADVAAGLTKRRWTVKELISYPVY